MSHCNKKSLEDSEKFRIISEWSEQYISKCSDHKCIAEFIVLGRWSTTVLCDEGSHWCMA